MKTEKNILIAFLLNLSFAVFEFFGGMFTQSVAIMSDAIHDAADALGIGVSWWCEKKSKQEEDDVYTYGYARYSVVGSVIITVILLLGSVTVLTNAVRRLFNPIPINYNGMIVFGVVGVIVNSAAAFYTRKGDSLNQKAVSLHMMEDVLGWVVVLIGAVIMKFTDISLIDPLLSIAVTIYIVINALRHLQEALEIFLERTPHGCNMNEVQKHLESIEGIKNIHHIHIWAMDETHNYATLHVVTNEEPKDIKKKIRETMSKCGISHVTIEIECVGEKCGHECCLEINKTNQSGCFHHHRH